MENWIVPIVLVAIAAVTAAGRMIYWMGEVNADRKGVNESIKGINDSIKGINESIKGIHDFMREIGGYMREIRGYMKETSGFMREIRGDLKNILTWQSASTVDSSSPLRLSELGHSISDDLHVRDWVERIAPSLTERVEGKRPFEIQSICFDYVRYEFEPSETQLAKLQDSAYDNGIDFAAVMDVLAVELRDRLLELVGVPTTDSEETANPAHS